MSFAISLFFVQTSSFHHLFISMDDGRWQQLTTSRSCLKTRFRSIDHVNTFPLILVRQLRVYGRLLFYFYLMLRLLFWYISLMGRIMGMELSSFHLALGIFWFVHLHIKNCSHLNLETFFISGILQSWPISKPLVAYKPHNWHLNDD